MRILLVILICFIYYASYAQETEDDAVIQFNLGEIAVLKIEPNNNVVNLNLAAPNAPGEKVKIVMANNKKWINFTSAVTNGASTRNISIKIDDGNVPTGLHLKLRTVFYNGSGKGQLGFAKEDITINKTSQIIVSDIGAAFTGIGVNNGYEMTYYLEIYDYKLLDVNNSQTLSISLTLSDY